jgi:DNA helicase II / ATP-dependent DNA helicase PcrA
LEAQAPSYNDYFLAAKARLNPAQLQAVEQTEGPVLVLAGPGTGKTQVLAMRIGQILMTTDARPQNILCLTFTDAGVHAMRERLLALIGPDALRVPVMTYHAFCNRVIQENSTYFGRGEVEPLTELERIDLIRQLIDNLPADHPLRDGSKFMYQWEAQLQRLFADMKAEGWKPGDIQRNADAWLRSLPHDPDYSYKRNTKTARTGDLKTDKIEAERERMERLKAAADLYPKFSRLLDKERRYEFSDMILWTLRAFEQHPELLRNYQERYQYILVDEYQDTNGAQNQLLSLLINYWESPNIFIVGDDDQSIYEFQGARLQNLLHFYQQHRDFLLTVALVENYRSTEPVLAAASRLIRNNALRASTRFDTPVDKTLVPKAEVPAVEVSVFTYDNRLAEDLGNLEQVEQWLAEGVPASEIAIIFSKHQQAVQLTQLLEKRGIPYQTKRPVNILEQPLIRYVQEMLCYLRDEAKVPFSGEERLFRLLHAPFFDIAPLALAQMALRLRPDSSGQVPYWREAILVSEWPRARALVNAIGQDGWTGDLPPLLERLLSETGVLSYLLNQPDCAWQVQVLRTFQQFVVEQVYRDPFCNLGDLLLQLDRMKDNHLSLPVQQMVSMDAGVQLVTAHSAKGLEFERVIVMDCSEAAWMPSVKSGGRRFALPPTLTVSGEEDALEARRRLFFVAITRAKRQLRLSCARNDQKDKPIAMVRFVHEMEVAISAQMSNPESVLKAQLTLLAPAPAPVITLPTDALLTNFLQQFTLSITALNRYLRCPLAFFYEDVLKVPAGMSEYAAFGQAMHNVLQQAFLFAQTDPNREFPSEEAIVRLFVREMERQRSFFSQQSFQQRLQLGTNYLRRYRQEEMAYWRKRGRVELRLDQVVLDGVPLTGVLDKIEYLDQDFIRIVDYKTGLPKAEKTAPPDEQQPQGGEYWRQLAFYHILWELHPFYTEKIKSGVIAWLEPNKKNRFEHHEITFSAEEVNFVKDLIRNSYAHIQAGHITQGCGQPTCAWCTMHQDRQLSQRPAVEEEGLDD